ncbi:MAG: OmpH family outer membrane protein, partial [Bacteroidaceae bacterium]|nr:OmpH family outer membrane protein [Bacteroidaceae bacterium]
GDEVGYVDSDEAIEEYAQAVKAAKALVDPVQPYQSQIKEAIAKFAEAYDALSAHVAYPAANTWYTIVTGSVREYAIDQPVYLSDLNVGANLNLGPYPIATNAPETDPYAVWRLVPVEGEEHQFYIQSLGTGQYWGGYKGNIGAGSVVTAHTPDPYKLIYYGQGGFRLQPAAVTDAPYTSLKADQSTQTAFIWTSATDHQQSWKFVPAESDVLTINWFPASTTQIMTLPFATAGDLSIVELNDGAQTYGVHSLTTSEEGTTLGLVAKTDFEAGEPFIIVTGESVEENGQFPIVLATPENVTDTSAVVANGLVGTLQGMIVEAPGMGIFVNSALTATTGKVSISARSGYLDPKQVVNGEGAADLEVTTGDIINAVKNAIAVKNAANSNVYTIDGKLVKRNAKATDALKGLNKGIYIVGKKKISVK